MLRNIVNAPSPNVGNCDKNGTWSSKNDERDCQKSFRSVGESSSDYFYCEGGGLMSKYDLNSICPEGALVAKNLEQCSNPCVQQGSPTVGGGCSDMFDCNYKNGETCEIHDISVYGGTEKRGMCVQGEMPPKPTPVKPKPTPSKPIPSGNTIMDVFTNCSQDMNNIDSIKTCLSSINNLSCDDINNLVLLAKAYSVNKGNYDDVKTMISNILTDQNEKLIVNIFNQINNAISKVNCTIDSINKNFDLQSPRIDSDNIKKQVVNNIFSNGSQSLQNNLRDDFSTCGQQYKTGSIIIIIILVLIILLLTYLYFKKN